MAAGIQELEKKLSKEKILPRRIEFHVARFPDEYATLKERYIAVNRQTETTSTTKSSFSLKEDGDQTLTRTKREERENLQISIVIDLMAWKSIQKIGAGLRNFGATCYMNSSLQCLTYLPPMANLALQRIHTTTCMSTSDFCALCSIERHIRKSLESNSKTLSPSAFAQNLKRINQRLRPGRQEDAHEFLQNLMDRMVACCLRGKDLKKMDPKSKAALAKTTIIHQIFGGTLQSQVRCGKCGYNSNTYDPFHDLSLELTGCVSVDSAFKRFCRPEQLDKRNKYRCDSCHEYSCARKQLRIFDAPKVLIVQLKRFDIFGRKVNKKIEVPPNLSIGAYVVRKKGQQPLNTEFQLCGVIVHWGGSTQSGHYYSYVRNSNGVWYEMNDTSVRQVSLSHVLKDSGAYMLFYVSKNPGKKESLVSSKGSEVQDGTKREERLLSSKLKVHSVEKGMIYQNGINGKAEKKVMGKEKKVMKKEIEEEEGATTTSTTETSTTTTSTTSTSTSTTTTETRESAVSVRSDTVLNWDDSLTKAPLWLEHKQAVEESKVKTGIRKRKREDPEREWQKEVNQVQRNRKINQYSVAIDTWEETEEEEKKEQRRIFASDQQPSFIARKRDRFDEELDFGRVKKIRKKSDGFGGERKGNPFSHFAPGEKKGGGWKKNSKPQFKGKKKFRKK